MNDLADRVVAYLAQGRVDTAPGIARGIRARDVDVRRLVAADPRFERRSAPAGKVGQARCYGLAEIVVPHAGTSSAALAAPDAPRSPSPALDGPWWLGQANPPRSVGEAIRAASVRRAA